MVQNSVVQALLQDGKAWNTGQMQQMTAQVQEESQALREQVQSMQQLTLTKEAVQAQEQSGVNLTTTTTLPNGQQVSISANNPSASCADQMQRRQAWAGGIAANQQMAGGLSSALASYNVSNTDGPKTIRNLAQEGGADFSASSIFASGGDGAPMPTSQQSAQAIANLTNPLPPVQLTSGQKGTAGGRQWSAEQNAVNSRLSMAQNALAQIAAWHQPTIDGQAFVQQWQEMLQEAQTNTANSGGSGLPPPPGSDGNHISPDGALDLAIQARYASPKWYVQLQAQTPSGVLKDLFQMGGIGLRVHYQEMVMAEYLAGLSAVQYANRDVDPLVRQVQASASGAMQQQANGGS
ncbi:hypothetical protein [Acidithiobacillus sp. IBUN Pt1247-S3]|uniref:hypothetical protein n=1 Tax=Acidithiobacillus sp. IBUN Pt1247-S3 TaxID=3166642 RepID=UPI0034E4AD04